MGATTKNRIIGVAFFAFVTTFILISWFAITNWDESNYPDPTKNYTACNMAYSSHICDPDSVIASKAQRNLLAAKLKSFEKNTRNINSSNENICDKKGVTVAIALTKHFHDSSDEAMKEFAESTLSKWNLDSECKKSFLIFVHARYQQHTKKHTEIKYSIALDLNVPFTECGFWKIYHSAHGVEEQAGLTVTLTWMPEEIVTDLSWMLNKIAKKMNDGEDTDSECTKDEAWHIVYGPWGWVVFLLFDVLITGCICFCCCRKCCKHCHCSDSPDSNDNQQNALNSTNIGHVKDPAADESLIQEF